MLLTKLDKRQMGLNQFDDRASVASGRSLHTIPAMYSVAEASPADLDSFGHRDYARGVAGTQYLSNASVNRAAI
jgi:hypothetical protein